MSLGEGQKERKEMQTKSKHRTNNKICATITYHIKSIQDGILDFLKINTSIMMSLLKEEINTHQV